MWAGGCVGGVAGAGGGVNQQGTGARTLCRAATGSQKSTLLCTEPLLALQACTAVSINQSRAKTEGWSPQVLQQACLRAAMRASTSSGSVGLYDSPALATERRECFAQQVSTAGAC